MGTPCCLDACTKPFLLEIDEKCFTEEEEYESSQEVSFQWVLTKSLQLPIARCADFFCFNSEDERSFVFNAVVDDFCVIVKNIS
mmetsp:Transcript_22223/g.33364  ORF Transcript_22223/g.33364 Transcript_22223/m.33364 type:complete len:84 (-) Transcript_22223:64-315(-)